MEKDTILYVLTKSQEFLGKKQIPNPRLDAELILSDVLNLERIKLYSNFDKKLTEEQKDIYRDRIKSRGDFKPVAYIIGKKNFYKSNFLVNASVLIPRPETEELIEWVSKEMQSQESLSVLDLCSGSGCIGISLKKDFPQIHITLSDISKDALEVAANNAKEILPGTVITLLESDLFDSIQTETKFDLILSNPPYIPIQEKASIMADVLNYEPHLALFLDDPETFYKKLLLGAYKHLAENGFLYMETHPDWVKQIADMSQDFGFKSSIIKKDLSHKERFIKLAK
jgi:release factor glutamine methyltransferase